mmetsp:Transcript_25713/g.25941  ORF Transcript_25713/g.25941 Transcript_25713/m.25941 type:complete len:162 (-) Transcript_25713:54-539(-)
MQMIPTVQYLETAASLWRNMTAEGAVTGANPTIFLASEDPRVVWEGRQWGATNAFQIFYTNLFDRRNVSAFLNYRASVNRIRRKTYRHHELEYLSMLLTIELSVRCQGWVCTLESNFCRVIDELRATIGNKANFPYFADLSRETCFSPPCIGGKGLISFGW